jgi:hypothetical protein
MKQIVIAFDVDGTLRSTLDHNGQPVALESVRHLMWLFRELFGAKIIVWSGSGELYARQMTKELHIAHWVDECGPKGYCIPDITVDDEDIKLGTVNLRLM